MNSKSPTKNPTSPSPPPSNSKANEKRRRNSKRFLQDHNRSSDLKINRKPRSTSNDSVDGGISSYPVITRNHRRMKNIRKQYDDMYHYDGLTYSQFLMNHLYANPKAFYVTTDDRPRAVTVASRKEPVIVEPEVSWLAIHWLWPFLQALHSDLLLLLRTVF